MTELEPASFDVERFELGPDACLEVHGRWSGVRGRRFMRPTLTAVAGGRQHRLLAVLDHKPWVAEEGEAWLAVFPWSTDPAALVEAELTVAPDVTVPLPQPSLPKGGRRRRAGSQRSPTRAAGTAGQSEEPNRRSKDDGGAHDGQLQVEHEAALRSRDEALAELDAMKRDRDRLRLELEEALAAREAAIAERHDVIEAEVRLRIADLRAETERERAAAGQAAQFARERDTARAERSEALSERDEAHAERDAARMERNRMLAQRDTARSQVEEATRRWEATAALGTHRTQQRDSATSERDRVARERDIALEQRDLVAGERDAALEQRDLVARERDAVLEQRDLVAHERDAILEQREQTQDEAEREVPHSDLDDPPALADEESAVVAQPTERIPTIVETGSTSGESGGAARPSSSVAPDKDTPRRPRRPRRPPAPPETRPLHDGIRGRASPEAVKPLDAAEMWRARLLAIAGLVVALVIFIVILTAK